MNPVPYIAAVNAAYSLPTVGQGVIDVLWGMDDDTLTPYAAVVEGADGSLTIGFAGTRTLVEWLEDIEILADDTPLGHVAGGIWETYSTLKSGSGKPLSDYAKARVGGHSRGGLLAALWAVEYGSPEYCLFACPKLLGQAVIDQLVKLQGVVYAEGGDVVPMLPLFGYPKLPPTTHLLPPGHGDFAYHHAFATYCASLTA